MGFRLAIDIGGTFTDLALTDGMRELHTGKELTTHGDLASGTIRSAAAFVESHALSFAQVDEIVHGTTLGSNVVLERRGWPTALLTTQGFRDVLVIQRQRRHSLYDLFAGKPDPLIPRSRVYEVPERIGADGRIVRELDKGAVLERVRALRAEGIEAVVISFLHSYRNPVHEHAVAQIVRRELPSAFVSVSSEISQRSREYERTNTAVVNAYIAGEVATYLRAFESGLAELGFDGPLYVMQSNGGVTLVETLLRQPVRLLESGPAAGALMAARIGARSGRPMSISFDMGGTTAKLALTSGGVPEFADEFEIDRLTLAPGSGLPIDMTAVELVEIGAGGGSIASVRDGLIRVGPRSAGSVPGPACYGRGGELPTLTDANLVLGYLNPNYFLGGAMHLDVEKAREAIKRSVARPLGLTIETAAWGIHELATEQMAAAARVISVERGKDPRELSLIGFGGAGPAHAARIARRIGAGTVIVPRGAGVASAIGLLNSDIRFEVSRSAIIPIDEHTSAQANRIYHDLQLTLRELHASSGSGQTPPTITQSADLRYVGQGYELQIAIDGDRVDHDAVLAAAQDFHRRYTDVYGYADQQRPLEATAWRLHSRTERSKVDPAYDCPPGTPIPAAWRPVYFDELGGFADCPVYRRDELGGAEIDGPAIIEERECTLVVPPAWRFHCDGAGHVVLEAERVGADLAHPVEGTPA